MKVSTATLILFSMIAHAQTNVTKPVVFQMAESFEKKYAALAESAPASCQEQSTRAEAQLILARLKSLDGLNPAERCHQQRLESKIHGLVGRLFKDAKEGKASFALLKDPQFLNCPEMMNAYVKTVAGFVNIRPKIKRGMVMTGLGITLEKEISTALPQLEMLKKRNEISGPDFQKYTKAFSDY